jgi:hypothetical protein
MLLSNHASNGVDKGRRRLHGLDPEAYLRQVIERIADHPINRL